MLGETPNTPDDVPDLPSRAWPNGVGKQRCPRCNSPLRPILLGLGGGGDYVSGYDCGLRFDITDVAVLGDTNPDYEAGNYEVYMVEECETVLQSRIRPAPPEPC